MDQVLADRQTFTAVEHRIEVTGAQADLARDGGDPQAGIGEVALDDRLDPRNQAGGAVGARFSRGTDLIEPYGEQLEGQQRRAERIAGGISGLGGALLVQERIGVERAEAFDQTTRRFAITRAGQTFEREQRVLATAVTETPDQAGVLDAGAQRAVKPCGTSGSMMIRLFLAAVIDG